MGNSTCNGTRWTSSWVALVAAVCLLGAAPADSQDLVSASTAEIIRVAGYRADELFFTTSDGYRLLVIRASNPLINGGRAPAEGRQPVLFIHGILTSSKGFVVKVNSTIKPTDRSRLDVASTSLDELQEILGAAPASQSLVTTLLDLGHIVYLLNQPGTPGSLPPGDDDNQATLNNGNGNDKGLLSRIDNRLLGGSDKGLLGGIVGDLSDRLFKDKVNSLIKRLLEGTSPLAGQSKELTVALVETLRTLPTPSQFLATLAVDLNATYWNFSMDQLAHYIVPECIKFVLEDAGAEQVSLVGHSEGGGIILMALTQYPEMAAYVNNSMLWAPALAAGHGPQSPLYAALVFLLPVLEVYIGPLPPTVTVRLAQRLLADICLTKAVAVTFCSITEQLLFGASGGQQVVTPVAASSLLDAISSRELAQLVQSFKYGLMHFYDYGSPVQNQIAYNQTEPPAYPTQLIASHNLAFWAGVTDWLITPEDVQVDISNLTVPVYYKLINETGYFNHASFLIHNQIARLLVIPCTKMLDTPQIPYNAGKL